MSRTIRETGLLWVLVLLVVLASARWGAVPIAVDEMWQSLQHVMHGAPVTVLHERIFLEIRLPRAILAALVGAVVLALSLWREDRRQPEAP